jgi:hypothetical protein
MHKNQELFRNQHHQQIAWMISMMTGKTLSFYWVNF